MADVQLNGYSNGASAGHHPAGAPNPSLDVTERASYADCNREPPPGGSRSMRSIRRSTRQAPRIRPTTRLTYPMTLEVIERHVFHITDPTIATDMRQALHAEDLARLNELITCLRDVDDGNRTVDVLEVAEVNR